MESQVVIQASLEDVKQMFSQLIDERLKLIESSKKIAAKEVMNQMGIKDLRVFKNACKRNNVDVYGLGKSLSIKASDLNKIIKKIN